LSDWSPIDIQTFDAVLLGCTDDSERVSRAVLERLPFVFESKAQYLIWRDALAAGLDIDGRDIALVGSAATGRSLNSRKQFGVFGAKSDLDIAVISQHHFEVAWQWFQISDVNLITGLDEEGKKKFEAHSKHYIFEGVVAAEYFLSYLPFGNQWLRELQRNERLLPTKAQGRPLRIRIYRNHAALRTAQTSAVKSYMRVLTNKMDNKEEEVGA